MWAALSPMKYSCAPSLRQCVCVCVCVRAGKQFHQHFNVVSINPNWNSIVTFSAWTFSSQTLRSTVTGNPFRQAAQQEQHINKCLPSDAGGLITLPRPRLASRSPPTLANYLKCSATLKSTFARQKLGMIIAALLERAALPTVSSSSPSCSPTLLPQLLLLLFFAAAAFVAFLIMTLISQRLRRLCDVFAVPYSFYFSVSVSRSCLLTLLQGTVSYLR